MFQTGSKCFFHAATTTQEFVLRSMVITRTRKLPLSSNTEEQRNGYMNIQPGWVSKKVDKWIYGYYA
jgi:hypothetical protein